VSTKPGQLQLQLQLQLQAARELDPLGLPLPPGRRRPTPPLLKQYISELAKRFVHLSPSCEDIKRKAQSRGRWLDGPVADPATIRPGTLVLFNWPPEGAVRGDGRANHVGLVVAATATGVSTIEFNTLSDNDMRPRNERERDGGVVARKFRSFRMRRRDNTIAEPILGFVQWG
jgi:hypothetical protein